MLEGIFITQTLPVEIEKIFMMSLENVSDTGIVPFLRVVNIQLNIKILSE
jgi:hypothetical protein